ncbi:MAG: hypothetical protein JSV09_00470 [Thermoplasmata archaeon]|nr:MAG: hypothetical protein JSV09_00470 [Thermoplasmata archaeon]
MSESKSGLDPWRVLLSHLMEFDSDIIPGIIDKTGMVVDWSLTEKQDYSNNYRRKAYRPRVIAAYNSLPPDDRLRVSHIIAAELSLYPRTDDLNIALKRIGWTIENDSLIPIDAEVKELFFPKGTEHDAYVEIRKIFHETSKSIYIVDPYIDSSIFKSLLTIPHSPIRARLLTFKYPSDFIHEAQKFLSQHSNFTIELRKSREFHDRFVVIDDIKCWHIGCSIKDAGNKAFMISVIEDEGNKRALIKQIEDSWFNSQEERIINAQQRFKQGHAIKTPHAC